jgi:hypothetical protein
MQERGDSSAPDRRKASIWTRIHPLFAIGQLLAFVISVSLFAAYFRGVMSFHTVHVSVLVKIWLMVGAVISGAFWERDVFGHWWFAPEFLFEDVMTLIVFITQMGYLAVAYFHPADRSVVVGFLGVAYAVYLGNVAQYIHRTQSRKKDEASSAAPFAAERLKAA